MKLIKQDYQIKQSLDQMNQIKVSSKKLDKYVTTFNYIDKILIFLNAPTGEVCIVSHATIVGAPNSKCWIYYIIFFSNQNNKKIIKNNKKQKEKA